MKWILLVIFITSHDGGSDINVFRFNTEVSCTKVRQLIGKEMAGKHNPRRGGIFVISDCFRDSY